MTKVQKAFIKKNIKTIKGLSLQSSGQKVYEPAKKATTDQVLRPMSPKDLKVPKLNFKQLPSI